MKNILLESRIKKQQQQQMKKNEQLLKLMFKVIAQSWQNLETYD